MTDTIKRRRTPSPNYTTQQYSDALERAMMRAKYPELYLQIIDNYLKIQENEYDNQTIPTRVTTERNAEAANGQDLPYSSQVLRHGEQRVNGAHPKA